jgi:hypothetical protein
MEEAREILRKALESEEPRRKTWQNPSSSCSLHSAAFVSPCQSANRYPHRPRLNGRPRYQRDLGADENFRAAVNHAVHHHQLAQSVETVFERHFAEKIVPSYSSAARNFALVAFARRKSGRRFPGLLDPWSSEVG